MADSFEAGNVSRSADTAPLVPPSSSEVTVRTMFSDLAAMGQSGGMPQTGGFTIPTADPFAPRTQAGDLGALPVTDISVSNNQTVRPPSDAHGAVRVIMVTVAIGIAALALFALGFYIIPKFLG